MGEYGMGVTTVDRVARGAALLDVERPGWVDSIDLVTLNISSEARCVLGQVFGDFEHGMDVLGVETTLHRHGFDGRTGNDYFASCERLTNEWLRVITARRKWASK